MSDRIRERLLALDRRLGEVPLPTGLERRILASTEQSSGHSRVLVVVAVAAGLILAFVLGLRTRPEAAPIASHGVDSNEVVAPVVEHPIAPAEASGTIARATAWDGALSLDASCRTTVVDAELRVESGCRMELSEPALAMEAWSSTRLARTPDGVRLIEGRVAFAVEHVVEGEPRVRIGVDAGAIEVLGTRFSVVQEGASGHVDLQEGAIAFVDLRGSEHRVVAGRRLRWSAGQLVTTKSGTAAAASPAKEGSDLDATLEKVAALRRAGRYRDAVEVLHRARRSIGDGQGADILSFEEGTLREHDESGPAICAFWRGHLTRFPDTDYAAVVRERLARTGCEEP